MAAAARAEEARHARRTRLAPATRGRPFRRHLCRAAGLEHNPLCRPTDRSRSRLFLAALLLAVLSVASAVAVSQLLLNGMRADAHRTAEHRHRVTATTVAAAVREPGQQAGSARAEAEWTLPGTGGRVGTVDAPLGAPTGTKVPLWVDDDGAPAAPPRSDGELVASAASYGLVVLSGAAAVSAAACTARRRALDRRADGAWEADWALVEPRWSGRSDRPGTGGR
ncbi:Rv1733c family protein [Kitasatospora sp. KL5]|uniref:Rv1733c family protein n=1 Tax=Kitasatospora sp. KL5 TaxID=3425125 RepID=UPI003D6F64B7